MNNKMILIFALISAIIRIVKGNSVSISNIPQNLHYLNLYSEIISELAKTKSSLCKAGVLHDPSTSLYYFVNPMESYKKDLASYFSMECKKLPYRVEKNVQRFYFSYEDIQNIISNNDDSVLKQGLQEINELQKGFELSLFPAKFFKKSSSSTFNNSVDYLCYDSFKVLSVDKNYKNYFLLNAKNFYDIVHCEGMSSNLMNNFIKYSTYCDEFCKENYVYYSKILVKCKCEFGADKNVILKTSTPEKSTARSPENRKASLGIELGYNFVILVFSSQLVYLFYFHSNEKNYFIKFSIFFYLIFFFLFFVTENYAYVTTNFDRFRCLIHNFSQAFPIFLLIYQIAIGDQHNIILILIFLSFNSFQYLLAFAHVKREKKILAKIIFLVFAKIYKNGKEDANSYLSAYQRIIWTKITLDLLLDTLLIMISNNFLTTFSSLLFIVLRTKNDFDDNLFLNNYNYLAKVVLKKNSFNFMTKLEFSFILNLLRYYTILYISYIITFKDFGVVKGIKCLLKFNFFKFFSFIFLMAFKLLSREKLYSSNLLFVLVLLGEVMVVKKCFVFFGIHFFLGFIAASLTKKDTEKAKNIFYELLEDLPSEEKKEIIFSI